MISLLSAVFIATTAAFSNTPLKAGDKAQDFSLKNVEGEYVSLSKINDAKGFIVVFSSNVCPVVKAYEDRIAALHEKYSPKGYPVIAINSNDAVVAPGDSYEEMKKTAKKVAGVEVAFNKMKPEIDNYYLIIMDSIIY